MCHVTAGQKKHKDFLFPAVKSIYADPMVIHSGKGARVTDLEGKSYLDFFGGIR